MPKTSIMAESSVSSVRSHNTNKTYTGLWASEYTCKVNLSIPPFLMPWVLAELEHWVSYKQKGEFKLSHAVVGNPVHSAQSTAEDKPSIAIFITCRDAKTASETLQVVTSVLRSWVNLVSPPGWKTPAPRRCSLVWCEAKGRSSTGVPIDFTNYPCTLEGEYTVAFRFKNALRLLPAFSKAADLPVCDFPKIADTNFRKHTRSPKLSVHHSEVKAANPPNLHYTYLIFIFDTPSDMETWTNETCEGLATLAQSRSVKHMNHWRSAVPRKGHLGSNGHLVAFSCFYEPTFWLGTPPSWHSVDQAGNFTKIP